MKFIISIIIIFITCMIQNHHGKAHCVASVLINSPVDKVWAVLVDTNKFKDKKRIKRIDILDNTPTYQRLRYTIGVFFPIPDFVVTVESILSPEHDYISFARTEGSFKDLRGYWKLTRQGNSTLVEYAMYLDTGFFIPEWFVQKAQMREVPNTLLEFKRRAEII